MVAGNGALRVLLRADDTASGAVVGRYLAGMGLTSLEEVVILAVTEPPIVVPGMVAGSGVSPSLPVVIGWDEPDASTLAEVVSVVAAALGDPDVPVRGIAREGHWDELTLQVAALLDPDLIILPGSRPTGRFLAWLTGDPWSHVAERATAPVLVVRPDAGPPETVLVILDPVPSCSVAVRALEDLPLPPEALVLVTALLPDTATGAGRRARHRAVRRLDAAVRVLRDGGHRAQPLVRVGRDARDLPALVGAAWADLVVVASGAAHVGGSTSHAPARLLLQEACASVLAVPLEVGPLRQRRALRRRDRRPRTRSWAMTRTLPAP